jgi:NadR type nicotinamide-nucleotide adenylyltransferase
MAAKKLCSKGAIIAVCGLDGDRGTRIGLPIERRYEIIKKMFEGDPLVHVVMMKDNDIGIAGYMDKWSEWLEALSYKLAEIVYGNADVSNRKCEKLLKRTTIFTGEPSYRKAILSAFTKGPNVYLLSRELNTISATKIRKEPMKYWNEIIGHEFKAQFAKRVLIIGTASEGKSTLTKDLARYFDAGCTEEYGHVYLAETNGKEPMPDDTKLTYDDYIRFLDEQYRVNSASWHKVNICDSDAMTTLMYAKYYSKDDRYAITEDDYKRIEAHAKFLKYDAIFVLPPKKDSWVQDGSRDCLTNSFEDRKKQYQVLMSIIGQHYCTEDIVYLNGTYHENYMRARDTIRRLLDD